MFRALGDVYPPWSRYSTEARILMTHILCGKNSSDNRRSHSVSSFSVAV